MTPYYQDESTTIYHGDCREILPTLGRFDLLLTDPPYGIDFGGCNASTRDWNKISGDTSTELAKFIFDYLHKNQCAVIWGANKFPELLPHRGVWICWDKRIAEAADRMIGSAIELAWENKLSGCDTIFRVLHGGVVNSDGGDRFHPTQKPCKLFRKVLGRYPDAKTIIDPFLGSGTTLVAAKLEGRKAVGIELEERYCEIAANRLCQGVLF